MSQFRFKFIETCLFTPSIPCNYQITITDSGKYIAEDGHGHKLEGEVSKRKLLNVSSVPDPSCPAFDEEELKQLQDEYGAIPQFVQCERCGCWGLDESALLPLPSETVVSDGVCFACSRRATNQPANLQQLPQVRRTGRGVHDR